MSLMERLQKIFPFELIPASVVLYLIGIPYFMVCYIWAIFSLFLPDHIYQNVEDWLYSLYQRSGLFFIETIFGVKLILHGDVKRILAKKERVLYISNHQSAVDWVVANMLASRQGSLPNVRYVLKHSLQYVPIFGFNIYLHGSIFVNRGNFKSEKMLASLKYLRNKKISSWIVLYPEGTRYNVNSPTALERSVKFSKDQGVKPFKQVLFPRYRGFFMLLDNLKDRFDAVYDVTLMYTNTKGEGNNSRKNAPTFNEFIKCACDTIHIHVNRIGINDVPTQEEEVKQWLWEIFEKKDNLLESYYNVSSQSGQYAHNQLSNGITSSPSTFLNTLSFATLITVAVCMLLTPTGRWLYIYFFAVGTLAGYAWKLSDILLTQYRRCKNKRL